VNLLLPTAVELSKLRILVVGDAMLDRYWHGKVERISPEAPVPILQKEYEENKLGGAANVALNIRSLGAKVSLLTVLGADAEGEIVKNLLNKANISTKIIQASGVKTTLKLRILSRAQQIMRIDCESEPNTDELLSMSTRFSELLKDHDVVVFSDYNKGSLAHIADMIKMAVDANIPSLVDPKGGDWTPYKGASVITPNLNELVQVIGNWPDEADLEKKVEILRSELEVKAICLTLSEDGMQLFEDGHVISIPSNVIEVVDVTGAGDTVIANLAIMIACGRSNREAIMVANLAAGKVVKKSGTAFLSYEELCE